MRKTIDWAQVPNGECVILNPHFPRIVTKYNGYATDVKTREVFSVQATEQCTPVLAILDTELNMPEMFKGVSVMLLHIANFLDVHAPNTAGADCTREVRRAAQTIVDRCNDALPKKTRGE